MSNLSSLIGKKHNDSIRILKFYSNIEQYDTEKYANQLLREQELASSLSVDFSHPRNRVELAIGKDQSVGKAISVLGRNGIYLKSKSRSQRSRKKQSFWKGLFSFKRRK